MSSRPIGRRQRAGGQRPFDAGDLYEAVAIARGDWDRPLVAEGQVPLSEADHVEVVEKPRAGMEHQEGPRDALGHAGVRQPLVGHRFAGDERQDEGAQFREGRACSRAGKARGD